MKALGHNSLSSYLRTALGVIDLLLMIGFVGLCVATIGYSIAMFAYNHHWAPLQSFNSDHIKIEVSGESDDPRNWQTTIPAMIGGVIGLGGALYIVRHLKKMLDTFRNNDPFRTENADHLRAIWIALAVIELSKVVTYELKVALTFAFRQPGVHEYSFTFEPNLTTWFVVFLLMVLAEVFREGARMRDEQNLTV